MLWIRNLLTYLALAASTAVTVAAAVLSANQGLPEKTLRDYSEIVRLLATSDVTHDSDEKKRRLISRIDESVHADYDWPAKLDALPDEERTRCLDNLFELMRVWFLDKVNTYHELHPDMRKRYVSREVREMLRWPALRMAVNTGLDEDAAKAPNRRQAGKLRMAELLTFLARAQDWKDREPPESQARIDEFIEAVQGSLVQGFDPLRPG